MVASDHWGDSVGTDRCDQLFANISKLTPSKNSGSPDICIPAAWMGGREVAPNASSCSRDSQTSLTRRLSSSPKQMWNKHPGAGQFPDCSSASWTESYWLLV